MKRAAVLTAILAALIVSVGVGYFYTGRYPIGADVPHNDITYALLEGVRERSIERASKNTMVPSLDDPDLLLAGGADYNDMCASCHLEPGKNSSDMSIGLYPSPPNLSVSHDDHEHDDVSSSNSAKRQFWIIKHGIKASGMPAWGPTHSDERIWAMVAFLQRLPTLDETQYQILTARGDSDDVH